MGLQAIARVNRPLGEEKTYGLVVDYWGVSAKLQDALAIFSTTDVQGALAPNVDDLPRLQARHAAAMKFFQPVADTNDLNACVRVLEPEDVRAAFDLAFRRFSQSMDMLLPDQRALTYNADLRWLGKIRGSSSRRSSTRRSKPSPRTSWTSPRCGPTDDRRPGDLRDHLGRHAPRRGRAPEGSLDRAAAAARAVARSAARAARVRQRRERPLSRAALSPEGPSECDGRGEAARRLAPSARAGRAATDYSRSRRTRVVVPPSRVRAVAGAGDGVAGEGRRRDAPRGDRRRSRLSRPLPRGGSLFRRTGQR